MVHERIPAHRSLGRDIPFTHPMETHTAYPPVFHSVRRSGGNIRVVNRPPVVSVAIPASAAPSPSPQQKTALRLVRSARGWSLPPLRASFYRVLRKCLANPVSGPRQHPSGSVSSNPATGLARISRCTEGGDNRMHGKTAVLSRRHDLIRQDRRGGRHRS